MDGTYMCEKIGNLLVEYTMGYPCTKVFALGKKTRYGYRKLHTVYMGSWNECIEYAMRKNCTEKE